jgi:hypothetical protein
VALGVVGEGWGAAADTGADRGAALAAEVSGLGGGENRGARSDLERASPSRQHKALRREKLGLQTRLNLGERVQQNVMLAADIDPRHAAALLGAPLVGGRHACGRLRCGGRLVVL